jgi:hypothetical protein
MVYLLAEVLFTIRAVSKIRSSLFIKDIKELHREQNP